MKKKLAVITTHPIQYYAPLFKLLAKNAVIDLKVFYTWGNVGDEKYDPGFGKSIKWDIPLLDGYEHTFVKNTASKPGSSHFLGIINPSLIKEIKEYAPNSILVFGWSYYSHLKTILYFKHKIPIYFRGDSTLLDKESGIKVIIKSILLRWIYKFVDYAFFVGSANKNYFTHYGLKDSQLIFAPHSIENKRFFDTYGFFSAAASDWKKKLNIGNTQKVILYVGKFEEKKDPILLIKAFIGLTLENIHLVLVGNGLLENEMRRLANGNNQIHFIDFQNQSKMPIVYCLGDVLCLPSKGPGETWGLAVNEAMACGLPIIASDRSGCSLDLIENGVNGFIFSHGDQKDLEQKIIWIFNRNDLQKMSLQSILKIDFWTIEKTVSAIESKIKI